MERVCMGRVCDVTAHQIHRSPLKAGPSSIDYQRISRFKWLSKNMGHGWGHGLGHGLEHGDTVSDKA